MEGRRFVHIAIGDGTQQSRQLGNWDSSSHSLYDPRQQYVSLSAQHVQIVTRRFRVAADSGDILATATDARRIILAVRGTASAARRSSRHTGRQVNVDAIVESQ